MLLNIVIPESAKPFAIPHIKEMGTIQGIENGLYVKFATPQVCEEVIERIRTSNTPIVVSRVVTSDAIYLENVDKFFVKNK